MTFVQPVSPLGHDFCPTAVGYYMLYAIYIRVCIIHVCCTFVSVKTHARRCALSTFMKCKKYTNLTQYSKIFKERGEVEVLYNTLYSGSLHYVGIPPMLHFHILRPTVVELHVRTAETSRRMRRVQA